MISATIIVAAVFAANPPEASLHECSNTQIASRVLLEKMGQGRFEISNDIYAPEFVAHGFGRDYSLADDNVSGRQIRAAFPDLKVSVLRTTAEGDLVAVHWRSDGTNTIKVGAFPGAGKRVTVDGMTFFRLADCRIVEEWSTYDNLSVMQQLGLMPVK
jgi:predicted SnoaL-like aldol condensation-catalyzing enzyme